MGPSFDKLRMRLSIEAATYKWLTGKSLASNSLILRVSKDEAVPRPFARLRTFARFGSAALRDVIAQLLLGD